MNFEDYSAGMSHVMDNKRFLYLRLAPDVCNQGIAFGRKYRILKMSYNILPLLSASVLAFLFTGMRYGA